MKRKWNSSNPLYRYVMSKKKSKSRATRSVTTGTTMARRRSFRRRASAFGRKTYRSARKSGTNTNLLMTVGASMLYGAGREKLSSLTAQYLPSIAGAYTDEVALGALGWYMSKKGGIIGALGKSALIIESARVGSSIGGQLFNSSMTTTANSNFYV